MTNKVEAASDAAITAVNQFVFVHRAAAIPALIGACVLWAVEHGGGDVVRMSLTNAIKMSRELEREIVKQ